MAKAVNRQKSNKPSFAAKVLQNMTLGSDLSINRPAIQTGFFRHWWQTFRANYGSLLLLHLYFLLCHNWNKDGFCKVALTLLEI